MRTYTDKEIEYIEIVLGSFDTRYPDRSTNLKILMQQQGELIKPWAEKTVIDVCTASGICTIKEVIFEGTNMLPTKLALELLANKKSFKDYIEHLYKEKKVQEEDRDLMKKSIVVAENSFRMSKRNTLWVIIGVGIAFAALIVSVIALIVTISAN